MAINRNQFSLFGLDLVAGYDYIRTGLHELLYDENQWLRRRLDPVITLVTSSGAKQTFKAGALMPGDNSDRKTADPLYAIALPESKVLLQELCLPASLRYQVERIVMNEVSALSPFPKTIPVTVGGLFVLMQTALMYLWQFVQPVPFRGC